MLRPRRLAEEAQGRPVESEAICGKEQRGLINLLKDRAVSARFFLALITENGIFPLLLY